MQKVDEAKANAVADLERRLALLGNVDEPIPPPSFPEPCELPPPPTFTAPPPPAYQEPPVYAPAYSAAPPAYPASLKPPPPAVNAPPSNDPSPAAPPAPPKMQVSRSGKDALMARLQAAKEKAAQKEAKPPPPPAYTAAPPPPAYDAAPPAYSLAPPPPPPSYHAAPPMAPPPSMPPPPSYDSMPPPPPPAFDSMSFPPPPPMDALPPPPMYMLPPAASAPSFESLHYEPQHENHNNNHYASLHAMEPPRREPEIDADILAALDPEEREQILEEQRQMLAQFEQQSKQAKPKRSNDDDFDVAEAMAQFEQVDAQLAADIAMAEELQKKEYGKAASQRAVAAKETKKKQTESQSWYGWMTGKTDNAAASESKSRSRTTSSDYYPANTTTTTTSSASRGPRLVAATTGDEMPYSEPKSAAPKKQSLFASAFGVGEEEKTLVAVPQFTRQRN